MRYLLLSCSLVMVCLSANAQCFPLNLTQDFEEGFAFPHQSLTALHDQKGRDYLYVAGMEDGVRIFDISSTGSVSELAAIGLDDLENLAANSLWQEGDLLYVALGNFFSDDENPGLAIIDVSDPENAFVSDLWKYGTPTGGAGVVRVIGDYAYLGGMQHGLFILDVSDPANITEVSQFVPDISFPNPNNPDPDKYNARGMHVRDDLVYLCYDAGGIRIIDVSDKQAPAEVGAYSLPAIDNLPRAYNNTILDGDHLFVAIDYCGLEVLDVSDPTNITQVAWWNPWDCTSSTLAWFSSPGHTNELAYLEGCNILGISAGKSEAVFVDVSDPTQPVLCDSFGSVGSQQGTWGISVFENTFYLAYIHVPLGVPFFSNWAGVRAVTTDHSCAVGLEYDLAVQQGTLHYDALSQQLLLSHSLLAGSGTLTIRDLAGRTLTEKAITLNQGQTAVPVSGLRTGIYMVTVETPEIGVQQRIFIP